MQDVCPRTMTGPNLFAPEAQILGRSSFWKAAFFFVVGTVMILVSIVFLMVSFDAGDDDPLTEIYCGGFGILSGVGGLVFLLFGAYWSTNNPPQVIIVQQSAANQVQSPSQTHVNHHQQATPNQPQEQLAQIPRQVMKKCRMCAEENPAGNTKCRLCASKF